MKEENNKCIRLYADKVQIAACKQKISDVGSTLGRLSKVLNLAGNEVRLKILYLLEQEEELCPCDLSDILNMSVPAISQHVRKLKDAGLIIARKQGQLIYYSISEEHADIVRPLFNHLNVNESNKVII